MTSGSPQRKHLSWIDEFVEATSYLNSPKIYRKWAALYAVSSALQRKVHLVSQGKELFPNLFVMLVGPPGLGKSMAMEPVKDLLSSLPNVVLSPARLSPEKFIQLVSRSNKILPQADDPYFSQSAYAVLVSEIVSFIRPQDDQIVTTLIDFFDCAKLWRYATLSRDEDRIENLYLTLLGGITPKTLAENFGAKAIGAGFTARVNFIYSDEYTPPDIFGTPHIADMSSFQSDLSSIHKMFGTFKFSQEAAQRMQALVMAGIPPIPTDPKLEETLTRRWVHVVKLAMIYSAAESNSLRIEQRHLTSALDTFLEYEACVPQAFDYMGISPMAQTMREINTYIRNEQAASGKPVAESTIKKVLLKDVQPQYVNSVLAELVQSKQIVAIMQGTVRYYSSIGD